ncbi:CG42494 [Drosophila busckii]|uniref:CG42494 n=1 Tax=Drosophila busckii TaxID=30019 RepID=A0A0M5JAV4_DROBS|nr:uncharacterized protein LOC108599478 [Drosophila busckii]ALC42931.1 CG42494 [Drosophila busckii]
MLSKLLIPLLLVHQITADGCGVCQPESNTACHSENTFSICMDGKATADIIPCPKDFYCTDGKFTCYENEQPICKPKANDEVTQPPTTTEKVWEPVDFCTSAGDGEYANKDDPTCKTKIYCYLGGTGKYQYEIYPCGTKKPYFDEALGKCAAQKPEHCIDS